MEKGRIESVLKMMQDKKFDYLFVFSNGLHSFLEPNPVFLLSDFKNIGESMVMLKSDGAATLVVSPSWDRERALQESRIKQVIGSDNLINSLKELCKEHELDKSSVAVVGCYEQSNFFYQSLHHLFEEKYEVIDEMFYQFADKKTEEELFRAVKATMIAEQGYHKLLEVAKPGMYEYQLAGEIDSYMKSLGADDNFQLMSASQHNQAVRPPSRRVLEKGDIILGEISPSYKGQFIQICRTAVIGPINDDVLMEKYQLLQEAFHSGLSTAVPGNRMSDVVKALNKPIIEAGYEKYCHPPYMRVRGHGVGLSSIRPGDVSEHNDTMLTEGMIFVLHPNQYIPETGYLLCGEPILITSKGAKPLTERLSTLDSIPV